MPPGVKGMCKYRNPVYDQLVEDVVPGTQLGRTVLICFRDYYGENSVDRVYKVARCIKDAFQAAIVYPNYVAFVNIGVTTARKAGYLVQGSSEDCELFVAWDFG